MQLTCTIIIINFIQFGLTPDKIGLVFIALSLPYAVSAPLAGKLADVTVSLFQASLTLS